MALRYQARPLKLIYCAKAAREDWPKRGERVRDTWPKLGQRYAEEIRPGIWMCLCCGKRVRVVT